MDNDTRYGALTTYNTTRFFRAVSFDHVEVSDAVRADSSTSEEDGKITLRRAFAYWLSLCGSPTSLLAYHIPRREATEYTNDHKILADEKLRSLDEHPLFVPWDHLQLEPNPLGGGATGAVLLAHWEEQSLALKLFDAKQHVAFDNELAAYTLLRGTDARVCELMLVTYSPSGQVSKVMFTVFLSIVLGLGVGNAMWRRNASRTDRLDRRAESQCLRCFDEYDRLWELDAGRLTAPQFCG